MLLITQHYGEEPIAESKGTESRNVCCYEGLNIFISIFCGRADSFLDILKPCKVLNIFFASLLVCDQLMFSSIPLIWLQGKCDKLLRRLS
jgi:hypothetical protein